jgi:sugar transferase (PEP-CTERM system associated)
MRKGITFLVLGDVVLALAAVYSGFFIRFGRLMPQETILSMEGLMRVSMFVLVVVFCSFIVEMYQFEKLIGKKEAVLMVSMSLMLSFFLLSALYYMIPVLMYGRGILALSLGTLGILQFVWHMIFRMSLKLPGLARRVMILGTGPLANQIGALVASTNHGHVMAGYVNCSNDPVQVPRHAILGNGDGLLSTAKREKVHKVVVSLSERRGIFPLRDVLDCKLSGVDVIDAPSFYEQLTGKVLIENITPSWFIFSDGFRITPTRELIKRIFDVAVAGLGLLLVVPLLPLVALAIKVDSRGPVLYRQVRVGQGERHFVLYKFRTMGQDAEEKTGVVWSQEDDPRITRMGRFLRKSRLDEVPQLYNVIIGEMSFVGPRPERPEFVAKLKEIVPYYSERHSVKPGITGWAQIKYSYGASVEDSIEKLRYDLYYIKKLGLPLDFLILLETIKVVLFGRGGR